MLPPNHDADFFTAPTCVATDRTTNHAALLIAHDPVRAAMASVEDEAATHSAVLRATLSELADAGTAAPPCVICLDEISERATAVPCGHDAFDFLCLASWLEKTPRCPLCESRPSLHPPSLLLSD